MKALTTSNGTIELKRGQATFKDNSTGRIYTHEEQLPNPSVEHQYPSTTTVKELLGSMEKKHRINSWQAKQIDAEESLQFYQARGEIAHEYTYYYICEQLDSMDEYEMDIEIPQQQLTEITYTPVYKQHNQLYLDGENKAIESITDFVELGLLDQKYLPETVDSEVEYGYISGIISGYKMAQRLLGDIKEIVYIEQYVVNDEVGYAGQFDLLYVSHNNELVLTDLKTSAQIHYGYRTQLSAYYNALPRTEIEMEVEEKYDIEVTDWFMQVVRHNNEQTRSEVETNKSWSKGHEYHYTQFKQAAQKIRNNNLPIQNLEITD